MPASNIVMVVGLILHISRETVSHTRAHVGTIGCGGWSPYLCGHTSISNIVQTLVTFLTVYQTRWPASLTASLSIVTLGEVVWVWFHGITSIRFSITQGVWTINGWWCVSSNLGYLYVSKRCWYYWKKN